MVSVIGRGLQLGLDPYTALQAIYIVDGQTALGVDIMLALVERSGLLQDKRHKYWGKGEERGCTVWIRRLNRTEQDYSFSFAEGRLAGLIKPGGGWTKYPDSMLYARAMSFGLRREFPDVLRGVHSLEELTVEQESPVRAPERPIEGTERALEEKLIESTPMKIKRRRRTKAEILAARGEVNIGEAILRIGGEKPVGEEKPVDIDKAIPAESKPHDELKGRALSSSVSEAEVLNAARMLRLAFEETELSQVPDHKIKTLLQHWPVVLGTISREKAKAVKQEASYE